MLTIVILFGHSVGRRKLQEQVDAAAAPTLRIVQNCWHMSEVFVA